MRRSEMPGGAVRGAVACVIVGFGLGAGVPAAAAPGQPTVGWWWAGRPSSAFPLQLDPVPAVPDGGLYVAADPSGPSGVSALRVAVTGSAYGATLTLTVADTMGTPVVDACPAKGAWEAKGDTTWDQRPEADCTAGRVAGVPSEDGTTLAFSLTPLLRGSTLDVVLLPGEAPGAFSTAFEAPAASAVVVQSAPSYTETPPPAFDDTAVDFAAPAYAPVPELPQPAVTDIAPPAPVPTATPSMRVTPAAAAMAVPEGFQYSAILAFPLLLLCACSYVAWALTRPINLRTGAR
jgi:hypothetical protein